MSTVERPQAAAPRGRPAPAALRPPAPSAYTGPVLVVEGLGARAGRRSILSGLALSVAPGQVLAVIGPSGSGKSTLLRLLAGLEAPSEGEIRFGDERLSSPGRVHLPPERRGVGLLLQDCLLFPHLDVRRNVALGVPPGTARAEAQRRVAEALERARVAHLASARTTRLSGGEAQRVALARTLAQEARLLLLDEPFKSLDEPLGRAIGAEVRRLVSARGLAAVLVTHGVEEAASLADVWVRLEGGRIVARGAADELSSGATRTSPSTTSGQELPT